MSDKEKILLVDIGNSRIKWALYEHDQIGDQKVGWWQENDLDEILNSSWQDFDQINAVYISNVAGNSIEATVSKWCEKHWNLKPSFAKVSKNSGGVINCYSNAQKLGIDRWLAMIAGWNISKGEVCIIDCGSAVTVDVINSEGLHQGGMISPGLALSGRALNDHTHALSLEQRENFPMLADNTTDAINSGCYHQFIGGIRHVVGKMQQQFGSDMKYIITGGDAELVLSDSNMSTLELDIRHEPDLILQGLMLSLK